MAVHPTAVDFSAKLGEPCTVDFIADTGDGTFVGKNIASCLALPVPGDASLQPGKVLLHGGDLCYPLPNTKNLVEKFLTVFGGEKGPSHPMCTWYSPSVPETAVAHVFSSHFGHRIGSDYRSALALRSERPVDPGAPYASLLDEAKYAMGKNPDEKKLPMFFAIPGNHDWLDGGNTFVEHIINRTKMGQYTIGNTKTYWAVHVNGVLFLGIDDQFAAGSTADIDHDQFMYFLSACASCDAKRVVIVLHAPFWLLGRSPGRRLGLLFQHLINTKRLSACLAGDLHFYAHHLPPRPDLPVLIVCGSGGAFLHSTHSYTAEIKVKFAEDRDPEDYKNGVYWPSQEESSNLATFRFYRAFFPSSGSYWLLLWTICVNFLALALAPAEKSISFAEFSTLLPSISACAVSLMVYLPFFATPKIELLHERSAIWGPAAAVSAIKTVWKELIGSSITATVNKLISVKSLSGFVRIGLSVVLPYFQFLPYFLPVWPVQLGHFVQGLGLVRTMLLLYIGLTIPLLWPFLAFTFLNLVTFHELKLCIRDFLIQETPYMHANAPSTTSAFGFFVTWILQTLILYLLPLLLASVSSFIALLGFSLLGSHFHTNRGVADTLFTILRLEDCKGFLRLKIDEASQIVVHLIECGNVNGKPTPTVRLTVVAGSPPGSPDTPRVNTAPPKTMCILRQSIMCALGLGLPLCYHFIVMYLVPPRGQEGVLGRPPFDRNHPGAFLLGLKSIAAWIGNFVSFMSAICASTP